MKCPEITETNLWGKVDARSKVDARNAIVSLLEQVFHNEFYFVLFQSFVSLQCSQ